MNRDVRGVLVPPPTGSHLQFGLPSQPVPKDPFDLFTPKLYGRYIKELSSRNGVFDLLLERPEAVHSDEEMIRKFKKLPLSIQLDMLLCAVTLTEEDNRLREKVMLDLDWSLRRRYPNCKLYPFGSIMTGLADSRSDIDIYVDLGVDFLTKMECFNATNTVLGWVRCPKAGTWVFNNVHPIRNTRVPIIKLEHAETGVKCDLSFENRASVQNTKLVGFYIKFNPQIMTLMKLLRYWAKYHGLIGSNKIKNYGLTLLVLVFLAENKIIPPIKLLQVLKAEERARNGMTSNPDEIEGWDTSFSEDVGEIGRVFKSKPFPNLADGTGSRKVYMALKFFKMYSELDLSTVVISPLLGRAVPKQEFSKHRRDFNANTSLAIQDPFVLNYNVGAVAHLETVVKFQVACASIVKHLEASGNYIECILDLFIPIPKDLGAGKFEYSEGDPVQAQKLDVIRESKTALGLEMPFDIAFPPHLSDFRLRLNRDYLKNCHEKSFIPSAMFELSFAKFVAPLWTSLGPEVLTKKFAMLWGIFVDVFLIELITTGLKLNAQVVKVESITAKPEMGWKMFEYILRKPEYTPATLKLVNDKLARIGRGWQSEIKYKMISVDVTYPFWHLRKEREAELMAQFGYKFMKINKMEIEGGISERVWKAWMETNRRKAKDKPKVMFGFNIIVKLDLSLEQNRPLVFIMFEKDNKTLYPHQDLSLCFQSISEILDRTFSTCLEHRFRTWLSSG